MDQVLHDMQIKVDRINSDIANKILENPKCDKYKGKFYLIESDRTITCIDNTRGNAWTENFSSIVAAAYWILGKYEVGESDAKM
ncbi:MAG: hypothetical protein QXI16_02325 [Sulfolobaceae archaeon]